MEKYTITKINKTNLENTRKEICDLKISNNSTGQCPIQHRLDQLASHLLSFKELVGK